MLSPFISRKACNSYILFNEDKDGLIVDPGFNDDNRLINHIKSLGVNIVAILITHAHYDHITALSDIVEAFPSATTYISEDEIDLLDNPKLNLSRFREDGNSRILSYMPSKITLLGDDETINIAGYIVRTIKTPFHTKGSMCFYVDSEKLLFSGDTLFYTTIGRTDLPTGSNRTVESSLKKLLTLPLETKVLPGHGVATKLERESKYNSYLRNI